MARNVGSRADPSLADLLQRRNSRDCSVLLDHFGVLYREHGPNRGRDHARRRGRDGPVLL